MIKYIQESLTQILKVIKCHISEFSHIKKHELHTIIRITEKKYYSMGVILSLKLLRDGALRTLFGIQFHNFGAV